MSGFFSGSKIVNPGLIPNKSSTGLIRPLLTDLITIIYEKNAFEHSRFTSHLSSLIAHRSLLTPSLCSRFEQSLRSGSEHSSLHHRFACRTKVTDHLLCNHGKMMKRLNFIADILKIFIGSCPVPRFIICQIEGQGI